MFERILTIKYNNLKNSFIHLNPKCLKTGSYVQLTYGDNKVAYFSVSASVVGTDSDCCSLNSAYSKILGIEENELVTVSEISNFPTVNRMTIAPVKAHEYEILELVAENIQLTLLDQIRVVNTGQKFIIWVGSNISVGVYVENVEPKTPGVIDFLTEVVINPNCDISEKSNLLTKPQLQKDDGSVFNTEKLKTLISDTQTDIDRHFQRFTKSNKDVIRRLIPVNNLPLTESLREQCTNYFNAFVPKESLPKSWSDTGFMIFSIKLLSTDLSSDNKIIYIKLCIFDKAYEPLGNNLFVNSIVFQQFGSQLGCRVVLSHVQEKPVVNEITVHTKKNYLLKVEEKFKQYLVKYCDSGMVLNPNILIDIGDNIKCSLTFSPAEAKFCFVDEDLVRNCKFLVSEGTVTLVENTGSLQNSRSKFEENVANFKDILNRITSVFSATKNSWENVIITGRPGTGKTAFLKILNDKLNSYPNFIFTKTIHCKSIKGKTVDSLFKLLSTTFSELVLYQPSVLFFDDLHLLCEPVKGDEAAPNSIYSNRVSEMMHAYLGMVSRFNQIGICATAESTSSLNKNIYSSRGSHLFKNLYSISDLSKPDRIKLIKTFVEQNNLVDVNFDHLSIKTEGYVIQDVVDYCKKTIFEAHKDGCDTEKVTVRNEHFERALKNVCVLSLQNVHLHSPGPKDFSDIGGLHDVKKIFIESLMWPAQYPNIFAKAPLRLQSGLLLYGPPGTGKTVLAAAAAKQCGLRLISIKGPELLSKYIGASEQAVRDIFQKAQSARPCILFFDEFDSLAPRRGHDNTGVTDRVVNQLLTQLDGVESLSGVCILAATSRPDLLDPALLRPGRLDRQILCPLPSKNDRLEILKALSKNLDMSADADLDVIATATKGYTGADLQSVLYSAQLSTIDDLLDDCKEPLLEVRKSKITQEHLEAALGKTRPSLPEQERRRYERIYAKFQGGTTVDEFRAGTRATLA
ncbi:hypothetical protein NQ315_015630 [Exocentrus adspersus]|uniref:Peroxisomal ATPase PEX1 n=1 Tax=Exocentrus adspersus TaxID=1586481 RepID=A0AAV8W320_9CUCU|nr:hypothetical protein NQ315_015630 [Exocentrus adspersus]